MGKNYFSLITKKISAYSNDAFLKNWEKTLNKRILFHLDRLKDFTAFHSG